MGRTPERWPGRARFFVILSDLNFGLIVWCPLIVVATGCITVLLIAFDRRRMWMLSALASPLLPLSSCFHLPSFGILTLVEHSACIVMPYGSFHWRSHPRAKRRSISVHASTHGGARRDRCRHMVHKRRPSALSRKLFDAYLAQKSGPLILRSIIPSSMFLLPGRSSRPRWGVRADCGQQLREDPAGNGSPPAQLHRRRFRNPDHRVAPATMRPVRCAMLCEPHHFRL